MDARQLPQLNIAVLVLALLPAIYSVAQSPFASLALASWTAAPFASFVPLLAASTTAMQHRCNLAAILGFAVLAVAMVGSAVQPSKAFYGVAVWAVAALLFVAAVVACACAALMGRMLAGAGDGSNTSALSCDRGRGTR